MNISWQLLVNKLDGSIKTYTFNTNNHEHACIVQNSTLIYLDNNKQLFDAKNHYNFQLHPLSDPLETIIYTADEKLATTTSIDTCPIDGTKVACAEYCNAYPTNNLCYDSTQCYELPNGVSCSQLKPGSTECSCTPRPTHPPTPPTPAPPTPAPTPPHMCLDENNRQFSCTDLGRADANACCGWNPNLEGKEPPPDSNDQWVDPYHDISSNSPPEPVVQSCYNNNKEMCCRQPHWSDNMILPLDDLHCSAGYVSA